jgi:hypothetical protein
MGGVCNMVLRVVVVAGREVGVDSCLGERGLQIPRLPRISSGGW